MLAVELGTWSLLLRTLTSSDSMLTDVNFIEKPRRFVSARSWADGGSLGRLSSFLSSYEMRNALHMSHSYRFKENTVLQDQKLSTGAVVRHGFNKLPFLENLMKGGNISRKICEKIILYHEEMLRGVIFKVSIIVISWDNYIWFCNPNRENVAT